MSEYFIRHNGSYVVEGLEYGVYLYNKDREYAMSFSDLAELKTYVEEEMHLNIANITVEEIIITETTELLKSHNGVWYNHNTHTICSRCGKVESRININKVATINGEEELCTKCYTNLESSVESYDDIFEEK